MSLMSNAYSFSNEEYIRSTLTVLGRCGMDKLSPQNTNETERKSGVLDSHVNGAVDYTLWFIISHWLYQRYFDDVHFLQQEWRLIERRLKCLLECTTCEEKGYFSINDNDWVFIDWTVDGEKSTALQILWWYALDCGASLAEKVVCLVVKDDGTRQRMSEFISVLSDRQSRLENSFLQMEDVQVGFSRHAHILGVCKFHHSHHENDGLLSIPCLLLMH